MRPINAQISALVIDPEVPARENRPGRRLYALTAAGESIGREAAKAQPGPARRWLRRRPATA